MGEKKRRRKKKNKAQRAMMRSQVMKVQKRNKLMKALLTDQWTDQPRDISSYDTVFTTIQKSETAWVFSESWNQSDFCN